MFSPSRARAWSQPGTSAGGRSAPGWRARYVKEVDAAELTLTFYQELYDADGTLREVHHTFPVDLGHKPVAGDE